MPQDLRTRLSHVFGALEQHNPHESQPAWSISDSAVRVQGKDDSESEDDESHEQGLELLRRVEEEEGDADGVAAGNIPSTAACKAFDAEEDEDEFDRLACESLQKLRCRPKPALKTQVAEQNIYDRMGSASHVSTGSPICIGGGFASPSQTRSRKRVRFMPETDEHILESVLEDHQSPHKKPVDGKVVQRRQTSLSYVPEHVRRPEAFTCYALDTPIIVGSGDDGSANSVRVGEAQPSHADYCGSRSNFSQRDSDIPGEPSTIPALSGACTPAVEFVPVKGFDSSAQRACISNSMQSQASGAPIGTCAELAVSPTHQDEEMAGDTFCATEGNTIDELRAGGCGRNNGEFVFSALSSRKKSSVGRNFRHTRGRRHEDG